MAPNLEASSLEEEREVTAEGEEDKMATFSPDQFSQILAAIAGGNKCGSFTQCTARFRGQRDPSAVEEFIAAISVYKGIERISDADALRGMPLLLEEYAATWWIGVKDTVATFEEAVVLIRTTFSPPMPDWKIYINILSKNSKRVKLPTASYVRSGYCFRS